MGLWYQTINPKKVSIGPNHLNINWEKQEKITGTDPNINAVMHLFLSSLFKRYFWNPKKAKTNGIQFNKPINVIAELFVRLFIELLSKKLSNPPIIKKKHEVKKTKLILSRNNFWESYQKLITKEINKNIIDNEIADGKRNKPNKKNNLPVSK